MNLASFVLLSFDAILWKVAPGKTSRQHIAHCSAVAMKFGRIMAARRTEVRRFTPNSLAQQHTFQALYLEVGSDLA
eukprot:1981596-Amphidinium_carterae.1